MVASFKLRQRNAEPQEAAPCKEEVLREGACSFSFGRDPVGNCAAGVLRLFACCALLALCVLSVGHSPAFADESDSENQVSQGSLPDSSFLYDVPISELVTADTFHDGQTVQVQGEVVGDLIADESDSSHCWVSLQELGVESPAVVSVYMTREFASQIDAWGHYGQQGTTLQVMGTFNLSCADHQGLSDIHAQTVSVVEKGKEIRNEASSIEFTLAWLFPLVGVVLALYCRHRNEQER